MSQDVTGISVRQFAVPLLITAAIGLAVAVTWQQFERRGDSELQESFERFSEGVADKVEERVHGYAQLLRAGAGLWAANPHVSRQEWNRFVDLQGLDQNYPGVQGLGYSVRLAPEQLEAHQRALRRQGFPDFVVKPQGKRDAYTSIIYLEPFVGRNLRAFGYDMWSDGVRREALSRATDLGDVAVTGRVTLLQETRQDVQAGLLAYFPVFQHGVVTQTVEQRRKSLVGWVYSPYRMNDMISTMAAKDLEYVRLQIFDGDKLSAENLLFDSAANSAAKHGSQIGQLRDFDHRIEFGGRRWLMRFTALPNFVAVQPGNHVDDKVGLVLIGVLLLGLAYSLMTTRRRALVMATELSNELRRSEDRYNALFSTAKVPMLLIDPEGGKIIDANEAAAMFYGYPIDRLRKMALAELNTLSEEAIASEMALASSQRRSYFHFLHRLASGALRQVEVHSGPVHVDGRVLLYSIVHDITERKQMEEKLHLAAGVFSNTTEAIMITDALGVIVDANEAFTRVTGFAVQDVSGKKTSVMSSGRHDAMFFQEMWKQLLGKGHWSGEIWNRRKDGQIYAVFETISAIRDEFGQTANYVATLSDITGFKTTEQRLEHLAHFDPLTQLPNRLLLSDRLQQAVTTSVRRDTHAAVCFVDLDGFKSINDRYGHDVGDVFLVHIASRLREAVREGDTLARIGGDEFVVILTDLQERRQVLPLLERLLKSAATATTIGGEVLAVSASIGVTFYPQHDTAVAPDTLLQQADGAMYRAKKFGKNACCFADECQRGEVNLPTFYRARADA